MGQYYYPVAALPLLFFDSPPPLKEEDFLSQVTPWLSAKDAETLFNSDNSNISNCHNNTLSSWITWNRSLKNELVKLRAQKKNADPDTYLREGPVYWHLADRARECFIQESPLASEIQLLKLKWNYLDELETGHYFDLEYLLIYLLKLKILIKKGLYTQELGSLNFTEVYGKMNSSINEINAGEQ